MTRSGVLDLSEGQEKGTFYFLEPYFDEALRALGSGMTIDLFGVEKRGWESFRNL